MNPQQPGPYPPAAGPGGAIAVTLKYHWLAFLMALFKPVLEINGRQVTKAWGRQQIPLPPGQYHVHVHVPYLLPPRVGPADQVVNVYPGQTVELEYRAPTIAFLGGALGPAPQKFPGLTASIALLIVAGVILVCACGGILVAALSSNSNTSLAPFGL